jgi:DNA ligase-1
MRVSRAVVKDTAPPVLLAHKWSNEDPAGWWISEKLDGVRAWWDGEKFLSRLGNVFHAPEWFIKLMPKDIVLDGELWAGRGKFQNVVSTVRKHIPIDAEWQNVVYVVFDAPNHTGTFEERIECLSSLITNCPKHLSILEQIECTGIEHLATFLKEVQNQNGEGAMLRQPKSLYEEGRSRTLLKVKTFFDDEAIVIQHLPGLGKHKGRLGALQVKWKDVTFKVGTGLIDKERDNPPPVGSKITFRYQELSNKGVPRFPSFISVRDYE